MEIKNKKIYVNKCVLIFKEYNLLVQCEISDITRTRSGTRAHKQCKRARYGEREGRRMRGNEKKKNEKEWKNVVGQKKKTEKTRTYTEHNIHMGEHVQIEE